jgi:hypothetical protein
VLESCEGHCIAGGMLPVDLGEEGKDKESRELMFVLEGGEAVEGGAPDLLHLGVRVYLQAAYLLRPWRGLPHQGLFHFEQLIVHSVIIIGKGVEDSQAIRTIAPENHHNALFLVKDARKLHADNYLPAFITLLAKISIFATPSAK